MNTEAIIKNVKSKLEPWELEAVLHALGQPYNDDLLPEQIEHISDELKQELETKFYPERIASDYASTYTMINTYDLLQWYAYDYRRLQFADDWINEYGYYPEEGDTVETILRKGQYYCIVTFIQIILDAIEHTGD